MKNIVNGILILLAVTLSSVAEASPTIADMQVEPASVTSGSIILMSCKVTHSNGLEFIERVGATVYHGRMNTSIPNFFDDGTHGDEVKNDGVYSIELKAPNNSGEARIVFHAADINKNETDSEPVILIVE